LGSTKLVIIGGLAELFSGGISMGMGAYLASNSDQQIYKSKLEKQRQRIMFFPEEEIEEVYDVLCSYGPSRISAMSFVQSLCQNKEQWLQVRSIISAARGLMCQFIMDLELKQEKPRKRDAYISAVVMSFAYFIGMPILDVTIPLTALGGILPMIPYFSSLTVTTSLFISIGITAFVLIVFGFFKARVFGCSMTQSLKSAIQTLAIGASAAGASYGIVKLVNNYDVT
jgi:vacuolar iron transporter family protein